MPKVSPKENKNIYLETREDLGYSREKAIALMEGISEKRLSGIELDLVSPHPEEIVAMANEYKKPELLNYYCTNECAIGKLTVPKIKPQSLSEIACQIHISLNDLSVWSDRLLEIATDNDSSDEEKEDLIKIEEELDEITRVTGALKLWIEKKYPKKENSQNEKK